MPDPSLPGIDHPLILLRDIEAGRAFYTRLGFTMTPVGRHPWGTTTSLAVLQRSALELMGTEPDADPDALALPDFSFGRINRDLLAEREGMSLVALHSRDVAADLAAITVRGIASQGTIDFRRRVRPPGGDWDEAHVSLGILFDPALPRASHFLAQQHRPHLLWVPEWMRHSNGATHIAAVTYLAESPDPVLTRLRTLFVAPNAGHEVPTGQGVFRVLRPRDWTSEFGAAPRPTLANGTPAGAAIDVAVEDPAAASALLTANGIETIPTPKGPAVTNLTACGNVLIRLVHR